MGIRRASKGDQNISSGHLWTFQVGTNLAQSQIFGYIFHGEKRLNLYMLRFIGMILKSMHNVSSLCSTHTHHTTCKHQSRGRDTSWMSHVVFL